MLFCVGVVTALMKSCSGDGVTIFIQVSTKCSSSYLIGMNYSVDFPRRYVFISKGCLRHLRCNKSLIKQQLLI